MSIDQVDSVMFVLVILASAGALVAYCLAWRIASAPSRVAITLKAATMAATVAFYLLLLTDHDPAVRQSKILVRTLFFAHGLADALVFSVAWLMLSPENSVRDRIRAWGHKNE